MNASQNLNSSVPTVFCCATCDIFSLHALSLNQTVDCAAEAGIEPAWTEQSTRLSVWLPYQFGSLRHYNKHVPPKELKSMFYN